MGCGLYLHDLILYDQVADLIFYIVSCSAVPPCVDFSVQYMISFEIS